MLINLPYLQVNMSGDELVVNVDQQEDRLLQDEQEKEQSRDRHNLATRSTMLNNADNAEQHKIPGKIGRKAIKTATYTL